jgi:hypothetical protein
VVVKKKRIPKWLKLWATVDGSRIGVVMKKKCGAVVMLKWLRNFKIVGEGYYYYRYILGVVVGVMVPKRNAEVVEELQNRGGWRWEMSTSKRPGSRRRTLK